MSWRVRPRPTGRGRKTLAVRPGDDFHFYLTFHAKEGMTR